MEMNIYKWLIVILFGGVVGILGMWFLMVDFEFIGLSFVELVD